MTYRPKSDKATVENAWRIMNADELALLEFLKDHVQGVGIAPLAAEHPTALEIVDRLVAKGEVARYPGCLFGVTPIGTKRLALAEKARAS